MNKILKLQYLYIITALMQGYMIASGLPERTAEVGQVYLDTDGTYVETERQYLENKLAIGEEHAISSSAFSPILESLAAVGVSGSQAEKILEGYRTSFRIDVDLEARNHCNGICFINSGFYTWFFDQLLSVVKASYIEFMLDKRFNKQRLQSHYVKKFLDNKEYLVPDNFFKSIVKMSEREVEEVFLFLDEICSVQTRLVISVRRLMSNNLTNEEYFLFKNNIENNFKVLDSMRDFLSEYLGLEIKR